MTTKAQRLVGIAMVTALIVVSMGFAAAQGGQASLTPGGMMGGGSTTRGMMGSDVSTGAMMGGSSATDGMMGGGARTMMAGIDMDAMHDQMMAAVTGKVPADLLARCDALHDQMMAGTTATTSAAHAAHHPSSGSTT